MYFFKLTLSYKGTRYCGWQIQAQGEKTIQGELNKSLEQILKSKIKTIGSGRTDSGVHALCQVVKVECEKVIAFDKLLKGLNSILPSDINVLEISECSESFRPTNDAKVKTYHYYFSNNERPYPQHEDLIANISFELDFELMKKTCEVFVGKHDFADFQCVGTEVSSTIREIYSCSLERVEKFSAISPTKNIYVLKISGSGFLKQMVRLIVGTLWQVGRGKLSVDQISESLKHAKGTKLGPVSPPEGLYLADVQY